GVSLGNGWGQRARHAARAEVDWVGRRKTGGDQHISILAGYTRMNVCRDGLRVGREPGRLDLERRRAGPRDRAAVVAGHVERDDSEATAAGFRILDRGDFVG